MASDGSYASRIINLMLTKQQAFISLQSCYYLLYQCLVPNTREALSLLAQHYNIPKDFERSILSGENPRVCNQGILNYLLMKLSADKDFEKFWNILAAMIKQPELRVAVERIRKQKSLRGPFVKSVAPLPPCHLHNIIIKEDDLNPLFPAEEGAALSVTDSDDDYGIIYTVTMVNARSCARPSRSPHQPCNEGVIKADVMSSLTAAQRMIMTNTSFVELQSHYSILARTMPDDYMNTVKQLMDHLSDDKIASILGCTDTFTANQRILDCLIEQLDQKEDTFDLCNWLDVIGDAPLLTAVVEHLKIDVINNIKKEDAGGTTSAAMSVEAFLNSLTVYDLSSLHKMLSASDLMTMQSNILTRLEPGKFGPKALEVLKKHYNILWRCFPDDYMLTLTTMCEECPVGNGIVELVTLLPTPEQCNRTILDYIIYIIKGDDEHLITFCALMEKFINNARFSKIIGAFRRDCTNVTFQSWFENLMGGRFNMPGLPSLSRSNHSDAQPQELPSTAKAATALREKSKQTEDDSDPKIFNELFPCRLNANAIAVLKKHYYNILRNFPSNHITSLSALSQATCLSDATVDKILSCSTSQESNREILDTLIHITAMDGSLAKFCNALERIVGSLSPVMESLRNDCLKLYEPTEELPSLREISSSSSSTADDVRITTASRQSTSSDTDDDIVLTTGSSSNAMITTEVTQRMIQSSTSSTPLTPVAFPTSNNVTDTTVTIATSTLQATTSTSTSQTEQKTTQDRDTTAALRTFDEYLHLLKLIEPQCMQEALQTAGFFPTNTPTKLSSSALMEKLLNELRSCIELNGAQKFIAFVNVLQTENRYIILGSYIFNTYKLHGGHGVLNFDDSSLSVLPKLSIVDLSEQIKWHQKQLQAGLQYQCPLPLPEYYIQRDKLLETIVNKLTEDHSISTVGTTVTITGVGGVGKSTLANALCNDLRLRNHFLDGFLWIRLGPLPVCPAIKLGQLYHLLTNKTEVGSKDFFIDKLRNLVANHLHKLLVIIDDVWGVSDAAIYTQVFNGCKIVMTTHEENLELIPSKMCLPIEQMSEEEAIQLLTDKFPKKVAPEKVVKLVRNMHRLPLLLKLTRDYLRMCCTEKHKSLHQAINCIQKALKETRHDVDKHKSAVVAMVLGILTSDEVCALQKVVSSMGFGVPIPVKLLPSILKLNEEATEKLCRRLLQLGLINHSQFIIPPNNKAMPCYEVHPTIVQYIVDHMIFESPLEHVTALDLGDINAISTVLAGGGKPNTFYHCLATINTIDVIILPNHIRLLFALIKCLQHEINICIKELSAVFMRSNKVNLIHKVLGFKENDAFKCVEKAYHVIVKDWRHLHAFLVDDKHNEAIEFFTGYITNHPLQKEFISLTDYIKDHCKDSQSLIAEIASHTDKIIQFHETTVKKHMHVHREHVRIDLRKGLVAMVKSGDVTAQQYQRLIDIHNKDMKP